MLGLSLGVAVAQDSMPDPRRTPGALNPVVTDTTMAQTICVRGWTRTVRPDRQRSHAMKLRAMRDYGQRGPLSDYEGDHLVPLALGGAPSDMRNYWPEPWVAADGWTAGMKDELEALLSRMVCNGRLSLAEAQRAIAVDWRHAYQLYVLGGD